MIKECESLLPNFCFTKQNWFPRYILLRRSVDSESIGGEDDQWQGFIKQMKKYFDQESAVIRQQFKSQRFRLEDTKKLIEANRAESDEQIQEFKNDMKASNKELQLAYAAQLKDLEKKNKEEVKVVHNEVLAMQTQM
jgi:hypothetical protein